MVLYYDETDREEIIDLIAEEMDVHRARVRLIPFEEYTGEVDAADADDEVEYYVYISPNSEELYILNNTKGVYFAYHKRSYEDTGYNKILSRLRDGTSLWDPEDTIVFVPEGTKGYVKATYTKVSL